MLPLSPVRSAGRIAASAGVTRTPRRPLERWDLARRPRLKARAARRSITLTFEDKSLGAQCPPHRGFCSLLEELGSPAKVSRWNAPWLL
jgi:hypothetical protein